MYDVSEHILVKLENQAIDEFETVCVPNGLRYFAAGASSGWLVSDCGDELYVEATARKLEYYCKFTDYRLYTREEAVAMIANYLKRMTDDI